MPNDWFVNYTHVITTNKFFLSSILTGTVEYDKVHEIIMNKNILCDTAKLYPQADSSCLEGYYSTLNQWHPKDVLLLIQ